MGTSLGRDALSAESLQRYLRLRSLRISNTLRQQHGWSTVNSAIVLLPHLKGGLPFNLHRVVQQLTVKQISAQRNGHLSPYTILMCGWGHVSLSGRECVSYNFGNMSLTSRLRWVRHPGSKNYTRLGDTSLYTDFVADLPPRPIAVHR